MNWLLAFCVGGLLAGMMCALAGLLDDIKAILEDRQGED